MRREVLFKRPTLMSSAALIFLSVLFFYSFLYLLITCFVIAYFRDRFIQLYVLLLWIFRIVIQLKVIFRQKKVQLMLIYRKYPLYTDSLFYQDLLFLLTIHRFKYLVKNHGLDQSHNMAVGNNQQSKSKIGFYKCN